MAPVLQSFQIGKKESLGSPFEVSVTKPTSTAEGDLLVAWVSTDGGTAGTVITADGSWTPLADTANRNNLVFARGFYKVAGASEPASYTFTCNNDERIVAGVIRITGQATSSPVEVIGTPNVGLSNAPTANEIETLTADSLVLAFVGEDDDDLTEDAGMPTSPWTGQWHRATIGVANSVTNGCASQTKASPGLTGNAVFALDASEDWVGMQIAIIPAASGTQFNQSVAGDMPASSGTLATVTLFTETVQGNMPASTGALTKTISKVLTGTAGDTSGQLSKSTLKLLAGDMPTSTGTVASSLVFLQDVAGVMGAMTGAVFKAMFLSLTGNFPSGEATVIKHISKGVFGNLSEMAGSVTKVISRSVTGELPAPTGVLGASLLFLQSVAGIMGALTGAVATVHNVGGAIFAKGLKILGSSFRKFIQ